jgi:hypothetical protein
LNSDILGKSLKSFSTLLHNGDSHVASLARLDVFHRTRFTSVSASNDFAVIAVVQIYLCDFFYHPHFLLSSPNPAILGHGAADQGNLTLA